MFSDMAAGEPQMFCRNRVFYLYSVFCGQRMLHCKSNYLVGFKLKPKYLDIINKEDLAYKTN